MAFAEAVSSSAGNSIVDESGRPVASTTTRTTKFLGSPGASLIAGLPLGTFTDSNLVVTPPVVAAACRAMQSFELFAGVVCARAVWDNAATAITLSVVWSLILVS